MLRARIETAVAMAAAVLTMAAVLRPTWIESLSGLEPDGGNSGAEWWLAIVFAAVALLSAVFARQDYRRSKALHVD
jgi:hypothetical protein